MVMSLFGKTFDIQMKVYYVRLLSSPGHMGMYVVSYQHLRLSLRLFSYRKLLFLIYTNIIINLNIGV